MKKIFLLAIMAVFVNAQDAKELFKAKCVMCHTAKEVNSKQNLIGPPADEVMFHVKEKYSNKKEAIAFMKDYIFNPDPKKALCASMDKFGLMPSQKDIISDKEASEILEFMFDKFPKATFEKKEKKDRANITFDKIDTNNDGFVSPKEFREFRAKRNGIDVKTFKQDLYFKKIDLNNDGKMDKEEFKKMREQKAKSRGSYYHTNK